MRVAVMQPYVFPYIGYFQLIGAVSTFIFYDDVSFIKGGWINKNAILINGQRSTFTIPLKSASSNKKICEIEIDKNNKLYRTIIKKVQQTYSKAPYFSDVFPIVRSVFENTNNCISDLAVDSIKKTSSYLNLDVDFKLSSQNYFKYKKLGRVERLISMVTAENGTEYINMVGGDELYTKSHFKPHHINLFFLKPKIEIYNQIGNDFVGNLSIIDVLMFNDKSTVKEMIKNHDLIT